MAVKNPGRNLIAAVKIDTQFYTQICFFTSLYIVAIHTRLILQAARAL